MRPSNSTVNAPARTTSEFARYVAVGLFNTVSGYSLFALANWSFRGLAYSYMYAAAVSNLVAITFAFLAYKWFVFKTHGNYLAEWLKCLSVYGTSVIAGLICLPFLVALLRGHLTHPEAASYLAAAILTIFTMVFSFFAHKNISFRKRT